MRQLLRWDTRYILFIAAEVEGPNALQDCCKLGDFFEGEHPGCRGRKKTRRASGFSRFESHPRDRNCSVPTHGSHGQEATGTCWHMYSLRRAAEPPYNSLEKVFWVLRHKLKLHHTRTENMRQKWSKKIHRATAQKHKQRAEHVNLKVAQNNLNFPKTMAASLQVSPQQCQLLNRNLSKATQKQETPSLLISHFVNLLSNYM